MKQTSQKIALVTGGNRGIGKAIVESLAAQGLKVLLACRDKEDGLKVAREIHGDVSVVQLELSDPKKLNKQIRQIGAEYPQIDVLVNNAGVLEERGFSNLSSSDLMHSMQVNALAAYELIQFFGNRMENNAYGRIVNVSSGWGAFSDGLTGPAAYSISKATLNAITKVAANNYPDSVKINALCPGWVRTRMGGASASRSPELGAETAVWLATLDDKGPTGQFFRDKKQINW
ncbi:SDR family NAD(P)-dependent oxidoreductase [Vibrio sp. THAF190c]|uniref:SDR family NAD(P)-dependent oxidoreductase n=1 Tax=Vibrio sp. THAF190c TaxID=2587865 RepID=UPI0012679272|nr:SDR family NAD(P)-dependent oxidoreductase [Vibrio sp. THAF190c]QFT13222.1 3-oxoacyl-[acyl-carrier-protein] reductase FabG [Vibrio sp. THAF190c]